MALTETPPPRRRTRRSLIVTLLLFVFLLPIMARAGVFAFAEHPGYREARWSSTGILAATATDPRARVLVFAARTGSWRGIFAVHTWIALKPESGAWTRYDVTGFGEALRINGFAPDAYWFSSKPEIVADVTGANAAAAIPKIKAAIAAYPYAKYGDYRVWPGPNSNTFIATLVRAVPELGIAMPPNAIGKDYRVDGAFFGLTPSGTGIEANLFGAFGFKLGWVEGVEVNMLGLVAGFDLRRPALKIPGYGRWGLGEA